VVWSLVMVLDPLSEPPDTSTPISRPITRHTSMPLPSSASCAVVQPLPPCGCWGGGGGVEGGCCMVTVPCYRAPRPSSHRGFDHGYLSRGFEPGGLDAGRCTSVVGDSLGTLVSQVPCRAGAAGGGGRRGADRRRP